MMREIYENSSEVIIWLGEKQRLNQFGEHTGEYEHMGDNLVEWFDDERDDTILEAHDGSGMHRAFCMIRLLSQGTPSKDIACFRDTMGHVVFDSLWAIMKLPWVRFISNFCGTC